MSRVLITGGGGFLGQKLARKLAETGEIAGKAISTLTLADVVNPEPVEAEFPVVVRQLDISDADAVGDLVSAQFDVIFHLAAIVSGQAEAEFDLGLAVNMFGSLNIFQAARALPFAPIVVYASSVAAHGGEVADPVPEGAELNPQTSYGSQKAIGELLLNDMSRRGMIDGRGLRLPTVTIRPGKANKAASSFMSSIFRDTLEGRSANCPVDDDYIVWHSAPRTVVENLVHAANVPAEEFGQNRNINLPGRSDTIRSMIEAMTRVAGPDAAERITWEPDAAVQKIALGWPGHVRHEKALRLGFGADASFDDSVSWFLADDARI